jgi:hypothetical protein
MTGKPLLIALGSGGLVARRLGSPGESYAGLSRIHADPSLAWLPEAVSAMKEALRLEPGTLVDWLILRPLVLGKVLRLPPVRIGALRSLATANIERFFPVDGAEWVADARALERQRSGPRHTLVTALAKHVSAAIEDVAEGADLRLGRIVPAPVAATVHARRLVRRGACPRTGFLEFRLPACVEVVRLEGGIPTGLIPFPSGREQYLRNLLDEQSPACSVRSRGWPLALELAETIATERCIPRPLTPPQLVRRRRAAHRRSGALAAVASITVLAGLGLQIVDQHRELRSLREVRAALATDVDRVLLHREALNGLETRVRDLATAEENRSEWTRLFRDLAVSLPESAYLTQVRGRPDSLELAVAAGDASGLESFQLPSAFKVMAQEATSRSAMRLVASWHPDSTEGSPDGD